MSSITRGDQGCEPHTLALRDYLDDCHAEDAASGYDPELGYGDEASRPPDYSNPEDNVAYPDGVVYEDESDFEAYLTEGDDAYHDAEYEPS